MRIAIEVFAMIITITLGCLVFASMIHGNNQIGAARDFFQVAVNRIEDSDGNAQVISQCVSEAKKNGYLLSVKDVTVYEENPSKVVFLEYEVEFPIYRLFGENYKKKAVIQGYAR